MMKLQSTRAVINCTIAAGLGVLGLMAAIILVSFANVQQQTRQMEIARSVALHVSEMRFVVIETILYNEPRPFDQWQSKLATMRSVLGSPPFDDASDNEALERIRRNFSLLDVLYERLRQNSAARPVDDVRSRLQRDIVARTMSAMLVTTQEMGDQAFELARRNQHRAEYALKTTQWCVGVGIAVLMLLLLALRKVVEQRILTPIASVQKGTEQIAAGNLAFRFTRFGPDEIGMLASRFNDMSAELERSHNALTQEIEERRLAQQQALAANEKLIQAVARADAASRAKSEFLANMSHEIRTPLNGVLGMTQLTLRTELNATQREYLNIVQDSGASLLRVINDILDFSKMEAGKLTIISQEFNVRERLAGCLRGFTSAIHDKHLRLTQHVADDVPAAVCGDADRVMQVLVNLVGNAIKFTDRGEVAVHVALAGQENDVIVLQFDVRDSGIGIDPAQQHRVFDVFAQADSSTTRQHGGTGLGLSICMQLVRIMGGRLWLDSTPGQGSVFHFTARFTRADVPARQLAEAPHHLCGADACALPAWLPREEDAPARSLNLLLVEDQAINRKLALTVLLKRGHSVALAHTGLEAIEQFRNGGFDVILMDIQMPEMDGYQAAAEIRRIEEDRASRVRIVAVTAHALEREHRRCMEAGMDCILIKPYLPEQLIATVEGLLPVEARQEPAHPAAPRPANPSSAQVFDRQAALRRVLGKETVLCQMAAMFIDDAPAAVANLREAVAGADALELSRQAHRIKGSAGIFGASAVMEHAAALEQMGRDEALGEAPARLAQFEAALAQLCAALSEMVLQQAA